MSVKDHSLWYKADRLRRFFTGRPALGARITLMSCTPECSISRKSRWHWRRPETLPCASPPFRKLILQIDWSNPLSHMEPIGAIATSYQRSCLRRLEEPFTAAVVLVRARPMRDFIRIVIGPRRAAAAISAQLVRTGPERASLAFEIRRDLRAHGLSPKKLACSSGIVGAGGVGSTRSNSDADQPPPSANISATAA